MSVAVSLSASRPQDASVQRAEPIAAVTHMNMMPSSESAPEKSPDAAIACSEKTPTTDVAEVAKPKAKRVTKAKATAKAKVTPKTIVAAKSKAEKAKATEAKSVEAESVEARTTKAKAAKAKTTKAKTTKAKITKAAKADTAGIDVAPETEVIEPKTEVAKTAKAKTVEAKTAKAKTVKVAKIKVDTAKADEDNATEVIEVQAKTDDDGSVEAAQAVAVPPSDAADRPSASAKAKAATSKTATTQAPAARAETAKAETAKTAVDSDDKADSVDDAPAVSPFIAVPAPLRRALEKKGFDRLTRVQLAALEAIEEGRDLQISSQTGSGKTVAVGMVMAPEIVARAEEDRAARGRRGPRALVIAPTRELATQVSDELSWLFASVPGAKVLSVTGGTSVDRDRSRLASGPRILVGTPGRLLDHIRTGALDCQNITQLVLDEADQMLDMGFREELEAILDVTPEERHTHLVSATFPYAIRRLAERYQKNPLQVEGTRLGVANEDIEHIVHVLHPQDRYAALVNTLLLSQGERTLIFVKTRIETTELAEQLMEDGFSAAPISGDLQQGQRTRTLNAFRNGSVDILVATDVAARGLDIPDVGLVVHGSPPMDSESYTHRSGRTGRAGNKGRCVVLAPYFQRGLVSRLLSQARITASWEEAPNAKRVQKAQVKQVRREIYNALEGEEQPPADLLDYSQRLLSNRDPALVVATLLQRFQPKPPTEPREIGSPPRGRDAYRDRNDRGGPPRGGYGDRSNGGRPQGGRPQSNRTTPGFTRFAINWGLRQGANPKRILAVVCRRGDVNGRQVGSINIDSHSSTFEVRNEVADHFANQAQRPDPRDPKIRVKKL